MDFFSKPFDSGKLKSRLKMAASRLEIDTAKKTALMKQNMREVAELLAESPPKEDKARFRAEALIRDDKTLIAYDILREECLLLSERINLIDHCKECPADLQSSISDLIFAAPRIEIPELSSVRRQFRRKYGRTFKQNAMINEGGILNARVVANLSPDTPKKEVTNLYMEKICKQYQVDWTPPVELGQSQVISPTPLPEIPVTTGLENTEKDDSDDDSSSNSGNTNKNEFRSSDVRHHNLRSLDVLPPPPFAPGYNANNGSKPQTQQERTSKFSGSETPRDGPAEGGTPVVVATPYVKTLGANDNAVVHVVPTTPKKNIFGMPNANASPSNGNDGNDNKLPHVSCF